MSDEALQKDTSDDAITIPLNFYLKNLAPKTYVTLNYCSVRVDESRKSVSIKETHDLELQKSLLNKGVAVTEDDILIPLKKGKKQTQCPSYFPFSQMQEMVSLHGRGVFMLTLSSTEYTILVISGDPLKCIDKAFS